MRARTAAAVLVLLCACSRSTAPPKDEPTTLGPAPTSGTTTRPSKSPAPTPPPDTGPPKLVRIGHFDSPLYVTAPPNDPRVFVVEQGGRVRVVRNGQTLPTPFLDVSGDTAAGGERGLLSIVFAPDFATSGHVYADYTDHGGDTRVVEFTARGDRADHATARELLHVTQPYANHNGGLLLFDREDKLLVGLGDGGSGGDPENRAQNPDELLGKILRIDPATAPGARPEIWAYGLRNPWRFSFAADGTLFLGDVGQNAVEEVDVVPLARQVGANYGWSVFEGDHRYSDRKLQGSGRVITPALTYGHDHGRCGVIGGYVYTGPNSRLLGRYLYGDLCTGEIFAAPVTATGLGRAGVLTQQVASLSSFGTDSLGRIYATSLGGDVFRID